MSRRSSVKLSRSSGISVKHTTRAPVHRVEWKETYPVKSSVSSLLLPPSTPSSIEP